MFTKFVFNLFPLMSIFTLEGEFPVTLASRDIEVFRKPDYLGIVADFTVTYGLSLRNTFNTRMALLGPARMG